MLRALLDAGVRPDLVVGTSVGAINGAVLAACPAAEVADRLEALWRSPTPPRSSPPVLSPDCGSSRAPAPQRTPRNPCVAPSPRSSVAGGSTTCRCRSSAAPPGSRTPRSTGSTVGRSSTPSSPPPRFPACSRPCRSTAALPRRRPRRQHPPRAGRRARRPQGVRPAGRAHRAEARPAAQSLGGGGGRVRDRAPAPVRPRHGAVPDDVEVHLLPAGDGAAPRWNSREALRYRDFSGIGRRIDGAYRASADYLARCLSDAPDGAQATAAPLGTPGGARPGDGRGSRSRCCSPCRCGCWSRPPRHRCCPAASGRFGCCGSRSCGWCWRARR